MDDDFDTTTLAAFCQVHGMEVPDTIADGLIVVEVAGVADIWILTVEADQFEAYAEVEGIDISSPVALRALLEGNYLGMATEAARVGIDPFSGKVVLCQRWRAVDLLGPDALDRLADFARQAASWRAEAPAMFAEHARAGAIAEGAMRL